NLQVCLFHLFGENSTDRHGQTLVCTLHTCNDGFVVFHHTLFLFAFQRDFAVLFVDQHGGNFPHIQRDNRIVTAEQFPSCRILKKICVQTGGREFRYFTCNEFRCCFFHFLTHERFFFVCFWSHFIVFFDLFIFVSLTLVISV